MRIVFMGTPDFAEVSLKELLASRHKILGVVTQPDRKRNRGKVTFSPVKELAINNGIKVLQPERVRGNAEFFDELKEMEPDLIVVVAFGQILPKEILELPKYDCINVHGSILPRLRGASPIHHAILDGEEKTGISIMKMEEGLDSGPIYSVKETYINDKDITFLYDELANMGGKLLIETIDKIEKDEIVPVIQDDSVSTYAPTIKKTDGMVDFNDSAVNINRKIKAFSVWPGAFSKVEDKTYKFFEAKVSDEETDGENGTIISCDKTINIKCGKGTIQIMEIQAEGKKRMPVSEFIKGNSLKPGMKFKQMEE
ncbi:MAG: methionyl-tRNA formyltransferase [Peptostreptococcaceae bacterium]|nr:methionyl-tRNA formyltransferase [Peptostreptococcaceae bacterium]